MASTRQTSGSSDLSALIEALRRPVTYPGQNNEIQFIETHASAVFIAGDDVYKLKKPVDFGFLDYRSAVRRRMMCHLEVQINQELAPGIYLGVVDLVRTGSGFQIGGDGETVDHLVHMRRLPEDVTLQSLIRRGAIEPAQIDAIARRIARFHLRASRTPEIDRRGLPPAIRQNVEENFAQVAPYIGRIVSQSSYDTISEYARKFLSANRGLLNARVRDGFIRDGHGDIRAEHVYIQDDIKIVDRIEFNDRIRHGDVAADIGFLAMDLDAFNRPDLSDRLIATYLDRTDLEVNSVLDFYRCYRAYVRGKVAAFRLDDPPTPQQEEILLEARRFMHLAWRYAAGRRRPRLVLMSGLTGSGKSTLARRLAKILPAEVIDSDSTRKRLAGLDPETPQSVPFGTGIYSHEATERVYGELLQQARRLLERGQTVLLDATYTSANYRQAALALAREFDATFLTVACSAPEDVVRERLAKRGKDPTRVSDGRWEIYLAQRDGADPLTPDELPFTLEIDTSEASTTQITKVLDRLEHS